MLLRRTQGFTLVELMIVVVVIGILIAIAIPNFMGLSDHAREAAVKNNAHTVQLGAEDFAVRNSGAYPAATGAAGVDGQSLADLLPQGERLRNPYTNALTEPVDGEATTPGQVGYTSSVVDGVPRGYTITGFGTEGVALILSTN